jgi:predicted negative regulator of RcsB-dependent stress response
MTDPAHPHHHPDAPDRFTRWGEDAGAWLEDHWRRALGVTVLLVLVGTGWAWYDHSRNVALSAARARVAEIATQFPGDGDDVPETAIRSALSRYETFLKTAPRNSTPYWTARLYLAEAHDALGEADAARAAYEEVLKGPVVFAGPARMRLAYMAVAAGDTQAAGTAFDKIVERYPGLAPQAALEQGRLAEAAKAKDAAIAAYKLVTEKFPETPQASDADARLRALGVVPEPAPAPPTAPAPAPNTKAAPPAAPGPAEKAPPAAAAPAAPPAVPAPAPPDKGAAPAPKAP